MAIPTCYSCAYFDDSVCYASEPPQYDCLLKNRTVFRESIACKEYSCKNNSYKQDCYVPKTHTLKIDKAYADAVYNGDKTFEVRFDDRGYQRGDYVVFEVNDCRSHALNKKKYVITYVLHYAGLKNRWCAFAIRPVETEALDV